MNRINVDKLSTCFKAEEATLADVDRLFPLYSSNRHYFDFFSLDCTKEQLREDMTVLPKGCSKEQKYFLTFSRDEMIALLDLITGYPDDSVCYIGLFMVHEKYSGQGIGTRIITELCRFLKASGFSAIRLAYGKDYEPAAHFWMKNGFSPLREATLDKYGELIVAQHMLR